MSSAEGIEHIEIVSRKDRNRMTYIVTDQRIKMKPESNENSLYKQSFVRSPLAASLSADRYRLYLLEFDSNGQTLPASKFLDFNPHDSKAIVVASESNTSQSQMWHLEEYDEDVWLIQSSNGKFLKNKGSGKSVSVSTMSSRDRNNKRFHWLLHPVS